MQLPTSQQQSYYLQDTPVHMKFNLVWHYLFCILCLFCEGSLKLMGSDKIHTASWTYIHVLSLCHL
jgi:hypothetical protein